MKPIALDFRAETPIYLQIVEQIRHMVASGELAQGHQLPTVRQLALELGVNFNTVARAYRLLDETGLISTQQGRGTYILEMPSAEVQAKLRQETLEYLTQRYLAEAARLGFTLKEIEAAFQVEALAWKAEGPLESPQGTAGGSGDEFLSAGE